MPFSAALLLEPTVTYRRVPSRLASTFLVQWWLIGPPGRSTTLVGVTSIRVCPLVYGTRTSASALATYKVSPTRAMPNGEFRPDSNTLRVSAKPSPLASRSKVMRLALGTPAPARFITAFITAPLMPLPSSGLGGALLSATSTSPLGSTYNQRGWSRPVANAATARPAAAVGVAPSGQPFAGAISTVGISL